MNDASPLQIRVLHIASGLGTGGAETMLFRLLRGLPPEERNRHEVLTLTDNCDFDFGSIGVSVRILDLKSYSNPISALWALRKCIQHMNPQLIHSWMYHANITTTLVAPKNVPIIWGVHHALQNLGEESWGLKLLIYLGKFLSQKANVVQLIFVSHSSKDQHLKIGYSKKKSVVICNGIDTDEFFPAEDLRRTRRLALGIDEKSFLIGSFGRFHPIKDHSNLTKALGIVRTQLPDRPFQVVFAGKDIEAKNEALVSLLQRDHIFDITHLIGAQTDMCSLYNAIDLYVLSSKSESLPNVLAESLACQTPIVTTDVGDAKLMTPDPEFCAQPNNAEELASKISKFLTLNASEVAEMKLRARRYVISNFNIEKALAAHLTIYEKAIGEWTI